MIKRVLDPGPKQKLIAVVPRAKDLLVLGYADGRNGIYRVPPQGGQPVTAHPLIESLRTLMTRRPVEPPR